jgi:predicted nucleic acid-binding protein
LELFAALKRHEREGNLDGDALQAVFALLDRDEERGLWRWIPVTDRLVRTACRRVRTVSGAEFVRAADALHLTCAADNGFDAIYSHDQRMLDAAACFGLEGRDILT